MLWLHGDGAQLLISCVASAVTSFQRIQYGKKRTTSNFAVENSDKHTSPLGIPWRCPCDRPAASSFSVSAHRDSVRFGASASIYSPHIEPDQTWRPGAGAMSGGLPRFPKEEWGQSPCPQCWPQAASGGQERWKQCIPSLSCLFLISTPSPNFWWENEKEPGKEAKKCTRGSEGLLLLEAQGQNQGAHEFGWERIYLYFHQSLNGI